MLDIRIFYEWIFSSFRIHGISTLVESLRSDNVTYCMVIKRSWIFGLYVSLLFIVIGAIGGMQAYTIQAYPYNSSLGIYIVTVCISGSVGHIIYAGLRYLGTFYTLHKRGNHIMDISTLETLSQKEGMVFTRFFNQITITYWVLFLISIIEMVYIGVSREHWHIDIWWHLISTCLITGMVFYYRRRMIDLHMDYVIVAPGKLYFIDQVGIQRGNQTLKLIKDILIIKGGYPNLISSFLNYGTLEISAKFDRDITAYDTPDIMEKMHMHYVSYPIETANEMNKMLTKTTV